MPPDVVDSARREFPRVAITHEWLTIPGGSEAVVAALVRLFPQAELFTTIYDPDADWPPEIAGARVHTSFLDRIPGATRQYPRLLPLMNAAFEAFDLSAYDLVLSSNHACAKNVVTAPGTLHVCYCHTPMRYAWDPTFLQGEPIGRAAHLALRLATPGLRRTDALGAARPDAFLANSTHVAARIAKFYRREATVVHPPVEVDPLLAEPRRDDGYYLCFGRVVPYKRVDLAVAACTRLGRPLKVAGTGRALDRLRAVAGPTVEFLGRVEDADVPALLAGARALLFPGEEDFGIVPVEAQAAGAPVIAYGIGGARDSVVDGETGVLFGEQTVGGLSAAIEAFEARQWDPEAARGNARRFGPERFRDEVAAFLSSKAGSPRIPG